MIRCLSKRHPPCTLLCHVPRTEQATRKIHNLQLSYGGHWAWAWLGGHAHWLGRNASPRGVCTGNGVKCEKNAMMQKHLEPSEIPGSWNVQSPESNAFGHGQRKLEYSSLRKSLIQLFADTLTQWILKGKLWAEHWRYSSWTSPILTQYAERAGVQNAASSASADAF